MATLTVNGTLVFQNTSPVPSQTVPQSFVVTLTGDATAYKRIEVGTTEQALEFDDVTIPDSIIVIQNLDATNYVGVRLASGDSQTVKIKPGECWAFRLGDGVTAPYLVANSAACEVLVWLFN